MDAQRSRAGPPRRTGTQSIDRAVRVLKELAVRPVFGWRAADLALRCDLDRATTHRILSALQRHALAQQRPSDRRYVLGPLPYELGLGLARMEELRDRARRHTTRLARAVGCEAAFFLLRSGNDFVCMARHAAGVRGTHLFIDVGTRRPLMSSAGGIAIVLGLPRSEAIEVERENLDRLSREGWGDTRVLSAILVNARDTGVALNDGAITAGWTACAVPVLHDGVAIGALMVASPVEAWSSSRARKFVEGLKAEAERLASVLGLPDRRATEQA